MRRRVLIVLLALGLLLAVLGIAAWFAARRPPDWWAPPRSDDGQALAVAENLERRLTQEISRVRNDETPWAVRLDEAQLNAWLALRMPKWIAHSGDPVDAEAQVHLVDGAIEIAVRRVGGGGEAAERGPVGVMRLRPQITGEAISARVESIGIGSLAMPGGTGDLAVKAAESLLQAFAEESGDQGAGAGADGSIKLAALLRGEQAPARWRLGDGREVELLAIELRPGELIVQCRTRRR